MNTTPRPPWTPLAAATAIGFGALAGTSAGESTRDAAGAVAGPDLASLSLEQLVEAQIQTVQAASKHEQKTTEAPSAVTVLTRTDLQQFGYRTLGDALRSVPGFYVTSDRGYEYLGVRGMNRPGDYGSRMLLMLDGNRVNDPVWDQASSAGDFPLDLDLVERIEVVRGPGSALYGNNAFFGVVDVLPRRGRDVGTEAAFTAGSFDTYSGRVSVGHEFTNGTDLLVSGSYLDSQGHERLFSPEFRGVNNGWAEGLDAERRGQMYAAVSHEDFRLQGGFGEREKAMPTAPYGSLFDIAPNRITDEHAWAQLKYDHEFESEWELNGRLYFNHYRFDGFAPFDGTDVYRPGETVFNRDFSMARWWGGELRASRTFFERHYVTLGVEGRHDAEIHQENYFLDPRVTVSDTTTRNHSYGLYLQDEYTLLSNLRLDAGIRYDEFSSFGSTWNPRAGLLYSPTKKSTFKLLYGQAFRAPNAAELNYAGVGYRQNHSLRPETIRSYELRWEQQVLNPLRWSTSLFYNQLEDQITLVDETTDPVVGGWIFRNRAATDVLGVETQLEALWENGIRGRVSYTYADARDTDSGDRLSNAPEHLITLNLAVPVYRRSVYAGFEVQAMSRRLSAMATEHTPGYAIANLTLFSHELVRGLEVSASLYNLFDHRYADPVGPDFTQAFIQQEGRAFRVKLSYRF